MNMFVLTVNSMSDVIDYETRLEIYEKFYWILNDCIVRIRDAINRLYTAEYEEAVGIINNVVSILNKVASDISEIRIKYIEHDKEEFEKELEKAVKLEEVKFHEEEEKEKKEEERSEESSEKDSESTAEETTETTQRRVKRKRKQTQQQQ